LKTYRLRLGLSQRKLTEKLGIDSGTLLGWERGKHKPDGENKKWLDYILKT
jgi:DNA-binding transcriptional regulator YiaG